MAREVTSHGMSGYRAGCHCEICRRAKREYMQAWRARRRAAAEAQANAGAEPLLEQPLRDPVDAPASALDMGAEPGPLERAFLADLREPDARVAFRRHLVGIARLNARVLDQIGTLDRLDLISPLQLRQLEVLGRLAILGFKGMSDDGEDPASVAAAAEDMLAELEAEGSGGAAG
jgi:hypothetical protein